jgi:hypothetical protein
MKNFLQGFSPIAQYQINISSILDQYQIVRSNHHNKPKQKKLIPGKSSPGVKQYAGGRTDRPMDQPMDGRSLL